MQPPRLDLSIFPPPVQLPSTTRTAVTERLIRSLEAARNLSAIPLDPIVSNVRAGIKMPKVKDVRLPGSFKIILRELVSHTNILYYTTVRYYLVRNVR